MLLTDLDFQLSSDTFTKCEQEKKGRCEFGKYTS